MPTTTNKNLASYRNEKNTFIKDKVSDVKRRVEIEVGDEKQPDSFLPQLKTKHWDNECNFSIRLIDEDYDNGIINTTEDGKVEWSRGNRKARLYEKDTGDEDGGFEFELELAQKPTDNIIRYSIRSKGLFFEYQPAMEGREEHVEGSYAVYHDSKKNNGSRGKHYKTGKAFHIYRPWAEDSNGTRVWCDLDIDSTQDELTITIPQDFLDNAVYPVIVDPTLGYTSIGASGTVPTFANASSDTSIMDGEAYTLPVNATLDSIHVVVVRISGSDPQTIDMFAAVYGEDSAGANSHDLVASVETLGLSISTDTAFKTFTAASESLPSGNYIIAALGNGEDADGVIRGRFDTGSALNRYFEQTTGAGSYATRKADDPWDVTDSSSTNIYSMYITYTEDTATFIPTPIIM